MTREMTGDLIRDGRGILCHQVNYQGVMGGGIAYSIMQKLLSQKQYKGYQQFCYKNGPAALGKVYWLKCDGRYVANMFSQNDFSRATDLTNYDAMGKCFREIRSRAERLNLPVSIPGYIGCGIAGGDWNRVKGIINRTFSDSPVDVTIIYWEGERQSCWEEDEVLPFN